MTFVLDASVTVSWCFSDESSEQTDALLRRLAGEPALVPALWELEIANVLVLAQRRRRITEAQSAHFIALVRDLPIEVDRAPAPMAELVELASRHTLTAYDAAYLHLARRTGSALATRDRRLATVAKVTGVECLLEPR